MEKLTKKEVLESIVALKKEITESKQKLTSLQLRLAKIKNLEKIENFNKVKRNDRLEIIEIKNRHPNSKTNVGDIVRVVSIRKNEKPVQNGGPYSKLYTISMTCRVEGHNRNFWINGDLWDLENGKLLESNVTFKILD